MPTTTTVTTTSDPPAEILPYLERLAKVEVSALTVVQNTYVAYVTLATGKVATGEGLTQAEALDNLVRNVEALALYP